MYAFALLVLLSFLLGSLGFILRRTLARMVSNPLRLRNVAAPPSRLPAAKFVRFFLRGPLLVQVAA